MSFMGRSIIGQPWWVTCPECNKKLSSDTAVDYTFCSLECREASYNEVDSDTRKGKHGYRWAEPDYCKNGVCIGVSVYKEIGEET